MATVVNPITITGLKELQKALKTMDGESQKRLRTVFNTAAETVVDAARSKVPSKTGNARASIRASSSQREARVSGGNKRKAPYYPWLDFGGAVGRDKSVKRPFLKSGRYIYAAFDANRDDIYKQLQDEMVAMLAAVGWDRVSEGS